MLDSDSKGDYFIDLWEDIGQDIGLDAFFHILEKMVTVKPLKVLKEPIQENQVDDNIILSQIATLCLEKNIDAIQWAFLDDFGLHSVLEEIQSCFRFLDDQAVKSIIAKLTIGDQARTMSISMRQMAASLCPPLKGWKQSLIDHLSFLERIQTDFPGNKVGPVFDQNEFDPTSIQSSVKNIIASSLALDHLKSLIELINDFYSMSLDIDQLIESTLRDRVDLLASGQLEQVVNIKAILSKLKSSSSSSEFEKSVISNCHAILKSALYGETVSEAKIHISHLLQEVFSFYIVLGYIGRRCYRSPSYET